MMDLNSLLEAVGLQNEQAATTAATVTGNYEQIKTIGEKRAVNAVAAGESDAIVTEQKMSGELKAQENKRAFATSVGSNMDVSSEIMSSLGLQLRQASIEAIKAKDIVAQKQSVGLFDNPLEYFINQITIGDDINRAEAVQGKADQIAQSLAQINASTQSTAQTQNAIAQTTSAAAVQAGVASVRQKAAEQAAIIEQQNLLYNVQGIEKVQALNQQQLSNMFAAKTAINSEKSLENAQATLAITRENHRIALEERRERIEAKKASVQEVEEIGNTINSGRAILGLAPIPAGKAIQLMKIGGELGNSIKDQYAKGAIAESTGIKVISDNPGKAALTIAQSQAPLAPAMKPVKDLLMQSLSAVANGTVKGANGLPVDTKNLQAVTSATNDAVRLQARNMAGNIKVGDANNIYAPPTYQSLIEAAPAVKDTALFQQVLAPLVTTGLTDINPTQVLTLTSQAVAKGQLPFNTAVQDIKTLFSGVAMVNNVTKDYVRVGLPAQNSYNTSVSIVNANTPNVLSFTTTQNLKVNMLDTTQINSLLSKQMAAQRINTFANLLPGQ